MKKSLLIFGGKSTAIEIRESAMLYPKLIFDNILLVIPDDEIIDNEYDHLSIFHLNIY